MNHDQAATCLRRALRWRGVGLVALVAIVPLALSSLLTGSLILGLATLGFLVLLGYAFTYGITLRVKLTRGPSTPDPDVASRDVVSEHLPRARIKARTGRLVAYPEVTPPYVIRFDWRRDTDELRVEADAPSRGELSRRALLARADTLNLVVDGLLARGYTNREP